MGFEYPGLSCRTALYPARGRICNWPSKGFSGLPLPTGAELDRVSVSGRREDENSDTHLIPTPNRELGVCPRNVLVCPRNVVLPTKVATNRAAIGVA
jgi:hypothetical protein